MDNVIQQARINGYVETIFGRRRYLSDINSQNSIVRGYAERNAINVPIQALCRHHQNSHGQHSEQNRPGKLKTQMIMQVHDELNFSVPKEELEYVRKMVTEEMEKAASLKVQLVVDCA